MYWKISLVLFMEHIIVWMQERPISMPGLRTPYVGVRLKNALSRRRIQERPI